MIYMDTVATQEVLLLGQQLQNAFEDQITHVTWWLGRRTHLESLHI